ncbi:FUSC family protein [Providencia alcalifaciens]|uniref:Fusaric acid resistance protein-like protein n=1 Tax=Providencia alcalifaciens 205/92 TaxID=1256988 RepID=A0AAV3M7C1_9GAMM|nr:FUSC family protein [Providencia alcalifaciens]EUD11324.1 fusaric acid resistance protein-like protein [Providencia alcalifaciens 205/92]MTC16147.1 FUSC family protein [Providencia alcalifaciens]MTC65254.1 FUSC family protein [Providencia alcalifaciens]WGZ54716.1 FUSC family protein [Providencia alcalifaciens]
MKKIPAIHDGILFSSCLVLSALTALALIDVQAAMWAAFSTLYSFNLFNAAKEYKNYLYTAFWLCMILVAIYIGDTLRLGTGFYIYLAIFSFIYYQLYGTDPIMDLTMKFMIIMSTIGTILPEISKSLTLGFLIGSGVTLITYYVLSHKMTRHSIITPLVVEKNLFTLRKNIIPRSMTYAIGLLLSLAIPRMIDLGHFYWTLLTFVFVLHPKSESIVRITFQRVAGSLISVLFLFLLFNTPLMPYIGLIAILVFAFLLPMSFHHGYTFMTFVVTSLILSVLEQVVYWRHPAYTLLFDRVLETALGGAIAIITSIILKLFREKSPES